MSDDADRDRAAAARYPQDDVIAVLYRQHADIRDALDRVRDSSGSDRAERFDAALALMKAHETSEQKFIRPVIESASEHAEAEQRSAEEAEADQLLAKLAGLAVDSQDFDAAFAELAAAVDSHAEAEETREFPIVLKSTSEQERADLGRAFLAEVSANS
jgi:hemerythrin superfamily protein